MPYQPIVGTLGYILSSCGTKVLLVHRNARSHDQHLGKYNGLGGKLEPNEDVVSGMKREILEEAGVVVQGLELRGTINWTGFGPNGENWLGFIFLIQKYSGTPHTSNEEGDLSWQPLDGLLQLPMWEGDRHFLPLVFDGKPSVFHGYMPYDGDTSTGWSYSRL